MPLASTAIRTWPGPGSGVAFSTSRNGPPASSTCMERYVLGISTSSSGFDARRRAVERCKRLADRDVLADEDRRVAQGVRGCLAVAQPEHQVHEVRRLLALERRHELLVVDPERVRGVVLDPRELLAPDGDVLVHGALAILRRKRVPRPHLLERVDDEIRRALRRDLPRPARARVLRG